MKMTTQILGRKVLKFAISAIICFVTFAANATLPVPKPGCSQGAYKTYVSIKWSTVNGAVGYFVYRSGNTDINSASMIAAVTDTTYLDYSVKPGTKYYYWVMPVDSEQSAFYDSSRYATGYAATIAYIHHGAEAELTIISRISSNE